jgi:hypothetical protein
MEFVKSKIANPCVNANGRQPALRIVRFLQLSTSRQALVRLCQTLNYGCLQGLEVRESDPVLSPPPVAMIDVKLDVEERERSEVDLTDFVLRDEVCRLMDRLDEVKNGTIQHIEVRAGIPRRVVFRSRLTEALQGETLDRPIEGER